jgi:hypothetical protein
MAKLPKHLIKKYGISKKAWAVFRSGKSSSTRRVSTMAKKRYSTKRRSKGSAFPTELRGVIGAIAYESLISPMIPLNESAKSLVELGAGFMFRKKGGWIGSTAKTLLILNAFQLGRGFIGAPLSNMVTGSNQTTLWG